MSCDSFGSFLGRDSSCFLLGSYKRRFVLSSFFLSSFLCSDLTKSNYVSSNPGKNCRILFVSTVAALTLLVLATANVAEFVSTSACHMVASLALFDYELASITSSCSRIFHPLFDFLILLYDYIHSCHSCSFSLICIHLDRPVQVAHALMPGGSLTSKAMRNLALRALKRLLFSILPDQKVVAVSRWTLKVAPRITCLHNHLPLESLPLSEILLAQELFEVICR